jgi:hypothetical protein
LFTQLSAGVADITISGYSPHNDGVPPTQQPEPLRLAQRIVNNYDTGAPITVVTIVGHADKERSVRGDAARKSSEERHSKARAAEAKALLIKFLKQLRPKAQAALDRTMITASGVGATRLIVLNPGSELDMRKNRRVEIFLGQSMATPGVPFPPEIDPPLPPDPSDDPNTVFASNRFKIKMLGATSVAVPVGGASLEFLIFEIVNNHSAKYTYISVIFGLGTPGSSTFAGPFSAPFSTPQFLQVDQFSGTAGHSEIGGGPLGIVHLEFRQNRLIPTLKPFAVDVPSGFSIGAGGDVGRGPFQLEPGSVRVFIGP